MIRTIYSSIVIFIIVIVMVSCSSKPVPIDYGADECYRCKMIISDERFGAELVTTKGRVYKFDAIECLVPIVIEQGADQFSNMLVTDFYQPRNFITTKEATFLISEDLPSPMGGYLSAFATVDKASEAREEYRGMTYDWAGLVKEYQ